MALLSGFSPEFFGVSIFVSSESSFSPFSEMNLSKIAKNKFKSMKLPITIMIMKKTATAKLSC